MKDFKIPLKHEESKSNSGKIIGINTIPLLKKAHYYIEKRPLIGDAPKEFIRAYFYEEGSTVRANNHNSWRSFIAKTAEKWYPHESVTEFMINRIGQELGLVMNEIRLVMANGQIRFLSKYFLRENEKLVHGAEICGEYLEDMNLADEIARDKKHSRKLFTFEFVAEAIKSVYPSCYQNILNGLVKMAIYDAITGNNDRHYYNWGIIDTIKISSKQPKFAPIFDSARGLFWNESDDQVKNHLKNFFKDGKKIVNYVEGACPRISPENNPQANHFELIKFIKEVKDTYKDFIHQISSEENEQRVLEMLKKDFYPLFIPERRELVTIILTSRFKKIRSI